MFYFAFFCYISRDVARSLAFAHALFLARSLARCLSLTRSLSHTITHSLSSLAAGQALCFEASPKSDNFSLQGGLRRVLNHSHSLTLFSPCRASHLFWALWGILQARTRFFVLLVSILYCFCFYSHLFIIVFLGGGAIETFSSARYISVRVRAERERARERESARERAVSQARQNSTYAAFHTRT